MTTTKSYQQGLLIVFIGVIILTPDVLLLRLIEADHWTIMFWRSILGFIIFFILNLLINKVNPLQAVSTLCKPTLLCAIFFASHNILFVLAATHTMAANALVIFASLPFIAALLTVFFLREKISLTLWLTIGFSTLGIAAVFWGQLGGSGSFGDICALLSAITMALVLITVNKKPDINIFTAVGLGALITALSSLFMGTTPTNVAQSDIFYMLLNGCVVFPIAFALIVFGSKVVSAPEVSLIMLLETVLGPLWVWIVLAEEPLPQTLIGGAIIISAVIINAVMGLRATNKGHF